MEFYKFSLLETATYNGTVRFMHCLLWGVMCWCPCRQSQTSTRLLRPRVPVDSIQCEIGWLKGAAVVVCAHRPSKPYVVFAVLVRCRAF